MKRRASATVFAGILSLVGSLPLAAAAALIQPASVTRSVTASTDHPNGTPDSQT